jgi:hypothetical protein
MKTESFILTLWITLALIFFVAAAALLESSTVTELRSSHATLLHQTDAIDRFKKRWSTHDAKNDMEYLKNHPNLVKHEKRGGNHFFEFDNLSSDAFNTLSNKILNSMLVIKKLTLKQSRDSKGSIIVEIES